MTSGIVSILMKGGCRRNKCFREPTRRLSMRLGQYCVYMWFVKEEGEEFGHDRSTSSLISKEQTTHYTIILFSCLQIANCHDKKLLPPFYYLKLHFELVFTRSPW